MAPFHYRHSGCLVRSEFELPEWHAFAAEPGEGEAPDIAIRLVDDLKADAPPDHRPIVYGDTLRFSVKDTGTWRVRGGEEIAIEPYGERDSIELRLFTLGSAWGALGYQRGWPMLHGSAVLGPCGAILFCGPQEAGKSTMAAALAERGMPLVSDDLSRVVPGRADRPTLLWPSSTRHKLWQEAIDALDLGERERTQDYSRAEKFHLEAEQIVPVDMPVPLVGIYGLAFDDGHEIAIERLSGGDAAKSVLSQTVFRPGFLDAMGKIAEQAVYAAQIAASVPVYRLTRPRDFARLHEVCEQIEDHVVKG